MASECTQDTVLRFITERGGRVKNVDLIEHFRSAIPKEPGKKAAAKEVLKSCVDSVAVVKVDNGEKYVCLKKKFRGRQREGGPDGPDGAVQHATGAVPEKSSENEDANQEIAPGSGCCISGPGVPGSTSAGTEMGSRASRNDSDVRKLEDIPEVEGSPRHETEPAGGLSQGRGDGTVPNGLVSLCDQTDGLKGGSKVSDRVGLEGTSDQTVSLEGTSDKPAQRTLEDISNQTARQELDGESDQKVFKRLRRKQSQRGERSADDGHGELVSGGCINTPKGSRKNFLEHMMSSSPQVRRSVALRNSVYLSTRCKDSSARTEVDAASLHSSGATDEENTPAALEPLEHEWMMCASDGEWKSLRQLLDTDPALVCKKDFVTGFTCLHWAAKMGKAELLALLVSFAMQRGIPVDVNARSSAGYTPLHLAAMHNHMEVVKLLVGAYDADVEVRDYSGKRANQYLRGKVAEDVLDIVGAGTDVDTQCTDGAEASGWRLSRVLQANLRPLKLLSHSASEDDVSTANENVGVAREKVLRRKSSLRSLKPRLSKIHTRAQIVHSTSLSGHFEREAGETSGSFRSRPKSNLFG